MKSIDEIEFELKEIEKQAERKLREQFEAAIKGQQKFHGFLEVWKNAIEKENIEEQTERKLHEQFETVIKEQQKFHDFLEVWENAIGKENIEKIELRNKQNEFTVIYRKSEQCIPGNNKLSETSSGICNNQRIY